MACSLCHGETLSGPVEGGVGPACIDCHKAGSPITLTDCSSCHNKPPDSAPPAGNAYPNNAGSHVEHNAIPEITGLCNACHNGFGQNSPNHFDDMEPADVGLLSTYDALSSPPATYDAVNQTCDNVKCHGGGQATPNWLTGTIDVDQDCESCHEGGLAAQSPQFNSYFSGRHLLHVLVENKMCIDCHDAGKLAAGGHFSNLATSDFEGIPAQTLRDVVNYDGSSCTASAAGNCHGTEGPW
jgi:predicted CxxxxCH...CXXCH cytochrome family protein